MRYWFLIGISFLVVLVIALCPFFPSILYSLIILGPVALLGFQDFFQKKQSIRRNFPFFGRFRYWLESIRPEINQYFIESNSDGVPFSREQRSMVYQRAKGALDTLPFGTQKDVYDIGYEWVNHSINAKKNKVEDLRLLIGSSQCKKPYNSSVLNISAMSYGSLSGRAIQALNGGAKDGNFAHNTGEGSISPHHKKNGGDLIWQLGTGYFGCRNEKGNFDDEKFQEKAVDDQIKMIEIKISQGAKPGHGGILPASKVSKEISEIRGVPMGMDILSPPSHSAFSTPKEMLDFIKKLRELSGGKPVGIKLCMGRRHEFISICKAIDKFGILPDFIAVDGGEGGTGAAPIEFSNRIGRPGVDSLIFADNALRGFSLRKEIKLASSGKVTSGFHMIKRFALGADFIYSARAMMLALGCIQALRCNANVCPAGIATQRRDLEAGIHVPDKRMRVTNYHYESLESVAEILGAMGLNDPQQLGPWHICRRSSPTEFKTYYEMHPYVDEGDFLESKIPSDYLEPFQAASTETFDRNHLFSARSHR